MTRRTRRQWMGLAMQMVAMPAALLLALWLVVVLGVYCTYTIYCEDGITLDRMMLIYLWLAIWVPFHLLAVWFLIGQVMTRS